MNGLQIFNNNLDNPTVSARELHEMLNKCKTFEDFFISVSKLRVAMDKGELKVLASVVKEFYTKYKSDSIAYLIDSIHAERALPCKSDEARLQREQQIKNEIINNFNSIFPNYKFVESEKAVKGVGRIDIYALCGTRPVIIELKTENKNPNGQLIAYGSRFENPILIGITEKELEPERKLENILYYTLRELEEGVEQWLV